MARKAANISIPDTFGVDLTDGDGNPLRVPGYKEAGENTPNRSAGYRHRAEHIKRLCAAYVNGIPMALSGPTGSGKTALAIDFLAGLNHEPIIVSSSDENETTDFTGSRIPTETGAFPFIDGPMARALRANRPLILDEADRNRPGVLAKYNHVFEGHPLYIESTGESLAPKPGFWFIMTMNTRGHGDEDGGMVSAMAQDQATMARFCRLHVGYNDQAEKERATEILGGASEAVELLCQFFTDLRSADVDCPVGTRQVVQFCHPWKTLGNPEDPLRMVILEASSQDERTQETIMNTYKSVFTRSAA